MRPDLFRYRITPRSRQSVPEFVSLLHATRSARSNADKLPSPLLLPPSLLSAAHERTLLLQLLLANPPSLERPPQEQHVIGRYFILGFTITAASFFLPLPITASVITAVVSWRRRDADASAVVRRAGYLSRDGNLRAGNGPRSTSAHLFCPFVCVSLPFFSFLATDFSLMNAICHVVFRFFFFFFFIFVRAFI